MRSSLLLVAGFGLMGCSLMGSRPDPLPTAEHVELPRYMGSWYVIANIPPWIERNAVNSVETYRLDENGEVPTTFTYRKNTFDGPKKTLYSRGFVRDRQTHAEWDVQFVWPIKAEYRIAWVAPDYSTAIVGRSKRDYVWLLARRPQIPEREYRQLKQRIAALGYDVSRLRLVPQRWPEPGAP